MLSTTGAKDFLIASDYPIDKVVWKHNGSTDAPRGNPDGTGGTTVTVAHGLQFAPQPLMIYSINNFYERYEAGSSPKYEDLGFAFWQNKYEVEVAADSTNCYAYLNPMEGPQHFWYRMIGLGPENEELVASVGDPINQTEDSQPFLLNSDNNYLKQSLASFTDYVTIADLGNHTFSIPHGLGYIPTALPFLQSQSTGRVQRVGNSMGLLVNNHMVPLIGRAHLTTSNLNVYVENNTGSSQTVRLIYRVYLDE